MPSSKHQATYVQITDWEVIYKNIFPCIVLANNIGTTTSWNKAITVTVL